MNPKTCEVCHRQLEELLNRAWAQHEFDGESARTVVKWLITGEEFVEEVDLNIMEKKRLEKEEKKKAVYEAGIAEKERIKALMAQKEAASASEKNIKPSEEL